MQHTLLRSTKCQLSLTGLSQRECERKKSSRRSFKDYKIREAKDVILPPPLRAPFASLGKPLQAFTCSEPECEYISISRKGIRLHCNQRHNWKSSTEEREHWHSVWVQTFFKSAGLQRYFTVLPNEEGDVD